MDVSGQNDGLRLMSTKDVMSTSLVAAWKARRFVF